MANSAVVASGDTILASQYNNLRIDVIDTTSGHTHNGTDSKAIAINATNFEYASNILKIKALGVDTSELNADAVTNIKITDSVVSTKKIGYHTGVTLLISADTERINDFASYTVVKDINIGKAGNVSVSFDMHRGIPGTVYGKIYVNGVAVGTEMSNATAVYATYTEDIVVAIDDNVQLYTYNNPSGGFATHYVRNFRIYVDAVHGTDAVVTD